MSHKDYTKFSAKQNKGDVISEDLEVKNEQEALEALNKIDGISVVYDDPETVIENDDIIEEDNNEEVQTKQDESKTLFVNGLVDNCERLNVRKEASVDSDVVTVLERGTEVIIDVEKSTDEFFKVSIDGVDGYCMKKFITSSILDN